MKRIVMVASYNKRVNKLWLVGLSVIFLSGCSTFKGSRQIDVSPFSDNTRIMFGDAIVVSRPFQWQYLKPYTAIAEYDAIVEAGRPLKRSMSGIVYYSNQLMAIKSSSLSETEKNEQLALYIAEALENAVSNQKVGPLQLNESAVRSVLGDIRNADTFLNGVAAATPIVHSVALAAHDRIDEIQDLVPPVVDGIDRQLDMEFGKTRTNYLELVALRDELMLSVTRLYRSRIDNRSELDAMLEQNASLRRFFTSDKATPEQMDAAEEFLLEQLGEIDSMLQQLDDAKAELFAKQKELLDWQTHVDNRLKIARNAVIIWAQSHQNLGNGIPVPPLIDLPAIAANLAGSAVGAL